jgi:hypothetical protein
MHIADPPVIVHPPIAGRRVRGAYFGTARSMEGLSQFLWLAGFDPRTIGVADPEFVEWRGGGPEVW